MVKSAFLNQNEDYLKSSNEELTRLSEMYSDQKYLNVEENSLNNKNTSAPKLKNEENKSIKGNQEQINEKQLLEEYLEEVYQKESNKEAEYKNTVAYTEPANTYTQFRNRIFTEYNKTNLNDLEYAEYKVYDKNEHFFKEYLSSNVSSNKQYEEFENENDKLDTKKVQLDKNTKYITENIQDNLVKNKNFKVNEKIENKDELSELYETFKMTSKVNELGNIYNYINEEEYTENDNTYEDNNYYTTVEGMYENYKEELLEFSEFEKGLVSMCEEGSTQQGSSLLSSPEQANNISVTSQKVQNLKKIKENNREEEGGEEERYVKKEKDTYLKKVEMKKGIYSGSTSFGERESMSYDSLYKMDALSESLNYEGEYTTNFYNCNYAPYSSNSGCTGSFGESLFMEESENYKNYMQLKSKYNENYNYFEEKGYGEEEKREEDITPFTHVVSSVATVADTVTPLCSSDLNSEFAETVQVLLERYLVGDLSVEGELYSVFMGEFNLENNEVYNGLVKYCTKKNLLYYAYKMLLQSTHLTEGLGTYANYVKTANGEKTVVTETYTQTLLALLTTQDSTHLCRSLLNKLLDYGKSSASGTSGGGGLGANLLNQAGGGSVMTKEADKVLKMYAMSISQMTRNEGVVFDRFLSILEDHQGRLDLKVSSQLLGYAVQADLEGKKQIEAWMGLPPKEAVNYLNKIFRLSVFGRLGLNVRFTIHLLDLMNNANYNVDFVENNKVLLMFLDFVATNYPISYSEAVLKLLEKKLFNAPTFFNALQMALKCDYGSMVTKICISALQILKGVVPVEFTTATFGKFEFITLENVNKLVILLSRPTSAGGNGQSSGGVAGVRGNEVMNYIGVGDKSKEYGGVKGLTLVNEGGSGTNLVGNLLEICKVLFSYNNKELFVPLVECCILVEDFQGCECIMKYYCDYYGMVSEVICEKVLLAIGLKGNFNYVNRLLKGTQSYESCEVFLTHTNSGSGSASSNEGENNGSSGGANGKNNMNGLIKLSIYFVRICISILNFNVAMNYVKPLLRLNQQNDEISNTLMIVATRLDSRSKLDSFLSFCERTSILINETCFNVILESCIKLKNNKRLLRIINKFRMWGLYPNIQSFGIIIKSLSCCNMIQECEELFYNYLAYTTYNGSIKSQNGASMGVSPGGQGKETMSGKVKGVGSVEEGGGNKQLFEKEKEKEKEVNTRTNEIIYGCMFDAYVNNNKVDNAMRLFEDMKIRGQVKPNTIMYTTLIKGYGQNKQLEKAMKIFKMMQQDNVVPNTVTYNSIIDACARVGDMTGATSLLEEMLINNIEPDLITFSTIIKGYCVQSDMDKSFQLLSIMYERGIMPDVILYNSLLEGCVKSGLLWLCEKLWKQMQEYNIPPSNFTLTILIKMYGRSGQLDKVFELADELPKKYNFSINTHVYTCLMSACITNGKYAMVLDIYKYMKKNGVKPDAKTFETIIQGLSRGGLFRDAAQVVMEVYSLTNSNNGEAQIANINGKVLERLFQRFYTHNTQQNQRMGSNIMSQTGGTSLINTKEMKEKLLNPKKGKGSSDEYLLNVAGPNSYATNYNVVNGITSTVMQEDFEELNSMYTSLARRLELFGIKIPRF